ncbi:uncharacterized protein [Diadema setosum]|uniref:uncharacterized protein n=1 Tax=Diadema setosum TaxID=31175 RepID=UPI003B3B7164
MDLFEDYPVPDYQEEEDRMTGYETIVIPYPRRDEPFVYDQQYGVSKNRGSSVIINGAYGHQAMPLRGNTWNAKPSGGVIIREIDNNDESPRIVDVTDADDQDIHNPDYPRSETGENGTSQYPTLPATAQVHPSRDYSRHVSIDDGRPDIQRVDLGGTIGDDEPPRTEIPAPPPPPPAPPIPSQSDGVQSQSPTDADAPPTQVETAIDGAGNPQPVHSALRRVLQAITDTPHNDQSTPDQTDNDTTSNRQDSRETYTQTRQQKSAESQTTLDRGTRPRSGAPDDSRGMGDNHRHSRPHGPSDERDGYRGGMEYEGNAFGPRFSNAYLNEDERRHPGRVYPGRDDPRRSQPTVIERIVITREIDPSTNRPVDSFPMHNMNSRSNIVYNNSVRTSGRRSRGWANWQGNWSPREAADNSDLVGIVAGMQGEMYDEQLPFDYMPGERPVRMGRTNQAYDISPEQLRRHPDVARNSRAQAAPTSHPFVSTAVPPPPPYTERDAGPTRSRLPSSPMSEPGPLPLGRSERLRSTNADSDRSSTMVAGWTRRTRVVFAVMLLLCVFLLLALVVVVVVYFTAGPGATCINDVMCDSPPLGYIIAFAIIGVLAMIFMFIGVALCCLACRLSREKRRQQYHFTTGR